MRRLVSLLTLSLSLPALIGCADDPLLYKYSRYDYWAFKARVGRLPEPNYLPWLMHTEELAGGDRALVACRWPDDAFPMRYHVSPPVIPREVQNEFNPRDPSEFVEAVHEAFAAWEEAIGRPVAFKAVDDPAQATVTVRLRAQANEKEEGFVLGLVHGLAGQCRVTGAGTTPETAEVVFAVHESELYVVDAHGLLTAGQVRSVALHEIGHLLGVAGHSPLGGDVMYKIADDSRVEEISEHDRNSLRGLYRLSPGAVYARLGETHAEPLSEVRQGPPKLDRELTHERFDFGVRFPMGWQVIQSPRGWVSVDGLSWDYDASIQLIALRADFESFYSEQRRALRLRGELESSEVLEIDGKPVARIVARGDGWKEETAVQEWGDGWLLVMVADCSDRDYELYHPWFERVLLSIEPRS